MLRSCKACGLYTLRAQCSSCGQATVEPGPPKYSPEDRYGAYRRRLRRMAETEGSSS